MPDKTVTMTFEQWESLIDLVRFARSWAVEDNDTAVAERWAAMLDTLGERPDFDGID